MRTFAIAAALLLAGIPLAVLAPASSAFASCTAAGVVTRPCDHHLVCVGGGGHGTIHERCQVSENLCEWLIHCGPVPVLP